MKRRAFIAGLGAAAALPTLPPSANGAVPFNEASLTAVIEATTTERSVAMVGDVVFFLGRDGIYRTVMGP